MPRKTRLDARLYACCHGFNEAAARCRGKQQVACAALLQRRLASMRPRPDAAENDGGLHHVTLPIGASMRPRPDAAENTCYPARRPQTPPRASMRPRPDAAENCSSERTPPRDAPGFNEAAARCRGKHKTLVQGQTGARLASMRPRPDAAEN